MGGREQIGSAAGGKAEVQNKAQQACGRCFIRNAPFCFSALAENPINSLLCQCCAAAGETAMATGVKISDRVPHVYTAAPRLCACVILESVKKLEELFIAPTARQILHETAQRAFARCECA